MKILKGQKVDIMKGKNISNIIVVLDRSTSNKKREIDGAAFLLEANGRCKKDKSFIF